MLKISRFNSDLGLMAFWGWDMINADDLGESYHFTFKRRDNEDTIYVTLGKELQYTPLPLYPERKYQCYITDSEDIWQRTYWLDFKQLESKDSFYKVIEATLEDIYQTPF